MYFYRLLALLKIISIHSEMFLKQFIFITTSFPYLFERLSGIVAHAPYNKHNILYYLRFPEFAIILTRSVRLHNGTS